MHLGALLGEFVTYGTHTSHLMVSQQGINFSHEKLLKRKIVLKFTIENSIKLYGAKHPTPVPLDSSINIEKVAD